MCEGNSLVEAERQKILDVLGKHKGNRSLAAAALGISRRTIHRRLKEYGIVWKF